MMDLSRRNFLQLLGVTSASVAIGKDLIGISDVGQGIRIREICQYDIRLGKEVYRYDILAKDNTMLCVSFIDDGNLKKNRKKAVKNLKKEMIKRGIRYSDLIDIPLQDYIESKTITV